MDDVIRYGLLVFFWAITIALWSREITAYIKGRHDRSPR